ESVRFLPISLPVLSSKRTVARGKTARALSTTIPLMVESDCAPSVGAQTRKLHSRANWRMAPPVPRPEDFGIQDGESGRDERKARFEKKSGRCANVPNSQHDSPSPEGSLIRLLAGLLTLASSS